MEPQLNRTAMRADQPRHPPACCTNAPDQGGTPGDTKACPKRDRTAWASKPDSLPCTPAGFTVLAFDGVDFANDCPLVILCSVEMAGDHVLWGDFFADRRLDSTLRHCKWATRVEAAA